MITIDAHVQRILRRAGTRQAEVANASAEIIRLVLEHAEAGMACRHFHPTLDGGWCDLKGTE